MFTCLAFALSICTLARPEPSPLPAHTCSTNQVVQRCFDIEPTDDWQRYTQTDAAGNGVLVPLSSGQPDAGKYRITNKIKRSVPFAAAPYLVLDATTNIDPVTGSESMRSAYVYYFPQYERPDCSTMTWEGDPNQPGGQTPTVPAGSPAGLLEACLAQRAKDQANTDPNINRWPTQAAPAKPVALPRARACGKAVFGRKTALVRSQGIPCATAKYAIADYILKHRTPYRWKCTTTARGKARSTKCTDERGYVAAGRWFSIKA